MTTTQSELKVQQVLHKAISNSVALYQQDNIKQALALTQKALLQFPKNPTLLQNAGGFAGMMNDLPLAEDYTRQSLAILPNDANLHNNLGLLLYKQDRFEQAMQCYQITLKLNPNHVDGHNNFGLLLKKQQQFDEAKQHYQIALKLDPNHIDTHSNLALLLKEQQQFDNAKWHYQTALKLNPNHINMRYNLGLLLQQQRYFNEAKSHYQIALKLDPDHAGTHNNLGALLKEQQHFDEAEQHYQIALKLDPDHAGTHNNLGTLLQGQKRFDEAMQHYQMALKLDPNHIDTQWNLSLLLLMLGHFSKAWSAYECRYHPDRSNRIVIPPSISTPQYQGQTLMGKSLLIVFEQGFGDNIQCIRYLPLLKRDKGVKHLILICQTALSNLFNNMDCIDEVVDCIDEVVNKDVLTQTQAQSLDYWIFIMSLPLCFNTTLETIPNQLPYLSSPKEQQNQWRDKLPKNSFNIGLVWKGQAVHNNDSNRSISSLSTLKPLWQLKQKLDEGISFISLQKGEDETEASSPPADQPMTHLGTQIQDFADSAAIVSQLDLVISVDTAMVHLAGSLNVPCWVLLPNYSTDWRWLIDREDSPWYPNTVRLFRQKTHGDWDEVIERVVMAIDEAVHNTNA